MKNKFNIILAILWLVIAVFFCWLLFSKLTGSNDRFLFNSKWGNGITISLNDLSSGDLSSLYKDYSFSQSNIEGFDITLVSANVHFLPSSGSDFKVELYGNWNEDIEPEVKADRKKITVKSPNLKFKNSSNLGSRKVVIQIPESCLSTFFDADISTVSGSIHANDISFDELNAESTSGSVHLDGSIRCLTADTVSGSIHVNGTCENLKCNSVSGSVHVETDTPLTGKNSINTVSGSAHITIPEGSGFEFEWNTLSGSVNNAFYNGKCGKSGSQIIGDGMTRIGVETISGSIHINKN